MVFGQQTPQDFGEDRKEDTLGAESGFPAPPTGVFQSINEIRQTLDDRGAPFFERLNDGLRIADEAILRHPDNPQLLMLRGSLRFQNLDLHLARLDFETVGIMYHDEFSVNIALSRGFLDIGDYDRAGKLIERLIREHPGNIHILTMKAEWLEKQERFADAVEVLKQILPGLSGEPEIDIRHRIANLLLDIDKPVEAIEIIDPLIIAKIGNSESFRLFGDCMSELDNGDAAYDAYKQALHLNPGNLKAHFNFGCLLFEMGHLDRARYELELVITSEPDDADAHMQLFEISRMEENIQDAIAHGLEYLLNSESIEDDDRVINFIDEHINELDPGAALLYARFLIGEEKLNEASEFLGRYLSDEEVAPPFEVLQAILLRELEKPVEALEWVMKALDRYVEDQDGFIVCEHPFPPDKVDGGDFAELVCLEAELHLENGSIEKALEALEEIEDEEEAPIHRVYRIRGEAAFLRKDYESALTHFQNALNEHPTDIDTLVSLGATYRIIDNLDSAINYYLRAFINDTEELTIQERLGEMYIEKGWYEDGQFFLKRFMEGSDDEDDIKWAKEKLSSISTGYSDA